MKDENRITKLGKKSWKLIKLGLRSLRENGVIETARKTAKTIGFRGHVTPAKWAATPLYTDEELDVQRRDIFEKKITISIITPLYNTHEDHLRDMIDSVIAQTYSNWELCMADGSSEGFGYVEQICSEYSKRDSRVKYRKLDRNLGIAGNSNACIDMSTGDYIALLDHDDVLHPAALHDVMKAVCEEADFIYTDEMIFKSPDLKDVRSVHCKPDFAIDNLRANNYICHLTAFRRDLFKKGGGFREGFDGAQDHDLMLRLTASAKRIVHIPKALYYWRAHESSTAAAGSNKPYASEAGKKAVMNSLESEGLAALIESARDDKTHYRIRYEIQVPEPKVSIIIPNCDHAEDLRCCIDSIVQKTSYTNYEIIIAENNSKKPDTFAYYDEIEAQKDVKARVIKWPGKSFNWSAINNYAVREVAEGDYILLLNNDTEIISHGWIEEMLMYAQRPDVGIVGAMLYYPDNTIQHAGVIVGMRGTAWHAFAGHRRGYTGYNGNLCYAHDVSAVTGACMLMSREVFDRVGGIDEEYAVLLNDIDLCLRVREKGYLIVWTPFAELYHFESKSRGLNDDTPEKKARAQRETEMFKDRWAKILEEGDPYYNPNLSLERSFELKMQDPRK